MGHSEQNTDDSARSRLIQAAKALVLRGNSEFSIASLCKEAGVERSEFRDCFGGKTTLMAALMQSGSAAESAGPEISRVVCEVPAVPQIPQAVGPAACESVSEPTPKAEQTTESSVSTPDAWLERRLRVFERALNALEAKAEATTREQARTIAQLEERLNGTPAPLLASAPMPMPVPVPVPVSMPQPVSSPAAATMAAPAPAPVSALEQPKIDVTSPIPQPQVHRVELAGVKHDEVPSAEEMHQQAAPVLIGLAPVVVTNKEELAGMLQSAREKARAAAEIQPVPPENSARIHWPAIGALSLVVVFVFAGFYLGRNAIGGSANAQNIKQSDGVSYRHAASTLLAKTTALADAGNTRAQARLALAYLRGQGSAGDANAALLWSLSAARAGNPVAQYLLGALYQQGDHVKADPGIAFAWFSRAAEKGNLKAMHNLAIAYAQGLGTTKDEAKAMLWFTRAAERGYVDSAFDLAVLYERGTGVTQDMKQALKWYGIAALAGDVPSKARADILRGQMKPAEIKLAENAAMAFAPLPALGEANNL